MENPYLKALQGFGISSDMFSRASNSLQRASALFNSSASLAIKLDALLKEEEARKMENYQKALTLGSNIIKSAMDYYQRENQFKENLALQKERLEETKNQNMFNRMIREKEIGLREKGFELSKERFKLDKLNTLSAIQARKAQTALEYERLKNQRLQMKIATIDKALQEARKNVREYIQTEDGTFIQNPNYDEEVRKNAIDFLKAYGADKRTILQLSRMVKVRQQNQSPTAIKTLLTTQQVNVPTKLTPNTVSNYNEKINVMKTIGGNYLPSAVESRPEALINETKNIGKVSDKAFKNTFGISKEKFVENTVVKAVDLIDKGKADERHYALIESVVKNNRLPKKAIESLKNSTNQSLRIYGKILEDVNAVKTLRLKKQGNKTQIEIPDSYKDSNIAFAYQNLLDNYDNVAKILTNDNIVGWYFSKWFGRSKDSFIKKVIQQDKDAIDRVGRPIVGYALKRIADSGSGTFINPLYKHGFNIVGQETKVTPLEIFKTQTAKEVFGNSEKMERFKEDVLSGLQGDYKEYSKAVKNFFNLVKSDKEVKQNIEDLYDAVITANETGNDYVVLGNSTIPLEDADNFLIALGILYTGEWRE